MGPPVPTLVSWRRNADFDSGQLISKKPEIAIGTAEVIRCPTPYVGCVEKGQPLNQHAGDALAASGSAGFSHAATTRTCGDKVSTQRRPFTSPLASHDVRAVVVAVLPFNAGSGRIALSGMKKIGGEACVLTSSPAEARAATGGAWVIIAQNIAQSVVSSWRRGRDSNPR